MRGMCDEEIRMEWKVVRENDLAASFFFVMEFEWKIERA
jgi:hypothetical protein